MQLSFDVESPEIKDVLRSVKVGRINHAVLFYGNCGMGRHSAAWYTARSIFCEGDKNVLPNENECRCAMCARFESDNLPDFHRLSVDSHFDIKSKAQSMGVNDIRALKEMVSVKPYTGIAHVVMIDEAEKLTTEAQNALLKTLEEPTGNIVFLLNTSQPSMLLSTVLSRCRKVRFPDASVERCAEILYKNGIDQKTAEFASGCARGALGRAYEIAASTDYVLLRDNAVRALKELQKGKNQAVNAATFLENSDKKFRDRLDEVLEILEVISRDVMVKQNGMKPFTDVSGIELDGVRLLKLVKELKESRAANVSWNGAVETAFLNYYS